MLWRFAQIHTRQALFLESRSDRVVRVILGKRESLKMDLMTVLHQQIKRVAGREGSHDAHRRRGFAQAQVQAHAVEAFASSANPGRCAGQTLRVTFRPALN